MTKYAFIAELIKAGCDIDKLSKEAKSLIESITTEEKKLSALDLFKDDYKDSNKVDDASDKSFIKGELMAAIATIEVSCGLTATSYSMSTTKDYIADGNYKSASEGLRKVYDRYITPDNIEAIEAYKTASRCLGQLM